MKTNENEFLKKDKFIIKFRSMFSLNEGEKKDGTEKTSIQKNNT
jgi:hypothetical protein